MMCAMCSYVQIVRPRNGCRRSLSSETIALTAPIVSTPYSLGPRVLARAEILTDVSACATERLARCHCEHCTFLCRNVTTFPLSLRRMQRCRSVSTQHKTLYTTYLVIPTRTLISLPYTRVHSDNHNYLDLCR